MKVGDRVVYIKHNPNFGSTYPTLGQTGVIKKISKKGDLPIHVLWDTADETDLADFEIRKYTKLDKALK